MDEDSDDEGGEEADGSTASVAAEIKRLSRTQEGVAKKTGAIKKKIRKAKVKTTVFDSPFGTSRLWRKEEGNLVSLFLSVF